MTKKSRERQESTDPISDDEPSTKAVQLRTNTLRIEIVKGPNAGHIVNLPGPSINIGSDRNCDLVLQDPTVSRVHLELRIERDLLRVIDHGSRNGTIVDGLRVRDAYPRANSIIDVGNTSLRLHLLSEIAKIPLSPHDHFGDLQGRSVAMRLAFAKLNSFAKTDWSLLIEGETGTGKELAARAVHQASPRAKGPFIVFDCATAHDSLFESQLFGHLKGSFTGATSDRTGVFEDADGGTLFLDEIGELPLHLQQKLLRALQEQHVQRIGENKYRKVNVRIIAATNRSLAWEVERRSFREDLYYRLAHVTVRMPPLRERPEDIPLLARHFETEYCGDAAERLSEGALRELSQQAWPGNARELRRAVQIACMFGTAETEPEPELSISFSGNVNVDLKFAEGREQLVNHYEKAYIAAMLQKTKGNVSQAADLAGISRKTFYDRLDRLGMKSKK